jgi:hypothetical protein
LGFALALAGVAAFFGAALGFCTIFVIGTTIFKSGNIQQSILELQEIIRSSVSS